MIGDCSAAMQTNSLEVARDAAFVWFAKEKQDCKRSLLVSRSERQLIVPSCRHPTVVFWRIHPVFSDNL